MSDQGRSSLRRKLTALAAALTFYAIGLACAVAITRLPLATQRPAILMAFAGCVLAALWGGVMVGRIVSDVANAGWFSWSFGGLMVAVGGACAASIDAPGRAILEIALTPLAMQLMTALAYRAAHVVYADPPEDPATPLRALRALALQAGLLLVGIAAGVIWSGPSGVVRLPVAQPQPTSTQSVAETLAQFPPKFEIHGVVRQYVGASGISIPSTDELEVQLGPVDAPPRPLEQILTAATREVRLADRKISLAGYQVRLPGNVSGEPNLIARPDGASWPEGRQRMRNSAGDDEQISLRLAWEKERGLELRVGQLRLLTADGGVLDGGGWSSINAGVDDTEQEAGTRYLRPLPVPMVLELDVWWGLAETRILAASEGAVARFDNDAYYLAALREGYSVSYSSSTAHIERARSGGRPRRTILLVLSAFQQSSAAFSITARGRGGQVLKSVSNGYSGRTSTCELACAATEVASLEFRYLPHYSRLRFPLAAIPRIFDHNRNVTNLLDMRMPLAKLGSRSAVEQFFQDTLGFGQVALRAAPIIRAATICHNRTVRQLLNRCYPGLWRVEDHRVLVGSNRDPRLIGKVLAALGEATP